MVWIWDNIFKKFEYMIGDFFCIFFREVVKYYLRCKDGFLFEYDFLYGCLNGNYFFGNFLRMFGVSFLLDRFI